MKGVNLEGVNPVKTGTAHGKKFQNAIFNTGNYNKGQLPVLKIKVCIRIVA